MNDQLVFKLLKETTSIQVISTFLKSKNLHFSASSWDQLIESRLIPSLQSADISIEELTLLLKDVEEHGRQHVFMYVCKNESLSKYFSEKYWSELMEDKGLKEVHEKPALLDQPSSPTIVDLRIDEINSTKYLTVKVVESRVFIRALDEAVNGNIITKTFERVHERAVTLFRLGQHGHLEIRIQSHSNSTDYEKDVTRAWSRVSKIFDKEDFYELSLQKAKDNLWINRQSLKSKIRFSKFVVKNLDGMSLDLSCGPQDQDILSSNGAVTSIESFVADDGHFDRCNVWFIPFNEKPTKELHVYLTKKSNEFAITSNCTLADYEYVINEIKSINE